MTLSIAVYLLCEREMLMIASSRTRPRLPSREAKQQINWVWSSRCCLQRQIDDMAIFCSNVNGEMAGDVQDH